MTLHVFLGIKDRIKHLLENRNNLREPIVFQRQLLDYGIISTGCAGFALCATSRAQLIVLVQVPGEYVVNGHYCHSAPRT
jgi:hypothetical protein